MHNPAGWQWQGQFMAKQAMDLMGVGVQPRLGEYLLLSKEQGHLATSTLFPCPGPMGKGVLVQVRFIGCLLARLSSSSATHIDCIAALIAGHAVG
jgi:hypothetical protein